MKKLLLLITTILLLGCEPQPIPQWFLAERYINVEPTFLPHEYPHMEKDIREACKLLEVSINSENFKDFILNGDFREDGQEVYDRFLAKDIELVFAIKPAYPNMYSFSVNKDTKIISAYNIKRVINLEERTAIIAHEYGHTIDFHHNEKYPSSFSYFIQFTGEGFFEFINDNVGNEPRKGYWLELW